MGDLRRRLQLRRRHLVHAPAQGRRVMSNVRVNGTKIYYEVRGTGPPVLLITSVGNLTEGGDIEWLSAIACCPRHRS
jgi:hypothetical protein